MQKKLSLIIGLVVMSCGVFSQSISPSVLNATGGSSLINSYTIEWNVGESIISTLQNANGVSITSGQLQPLPSIVSIEEIEVGEVIIYPNPTRENVVVQSSIDYAYLRLYDMTGRLIMEEQPTNTIHQITLSDLSAGVYELVLFNEKGQRFYQQSISKVN